MTNFLTLLPIVASAMSLATANPISTNQPYSVTWKQTQTAPSQLSGGLGSSVQGHFPSMSTDQIGLGCGLDWKNGQLHAGFDGGDKDNGVGGGFTWTPHSLSGIVGLQYKDQKINLNLTITDQNEVLFNVNGKDLEWNKVITAEDQINDWMPTRKDAGPVQWYDGHPYALGNPVYHTPDGKKVNEGDVPKGKDPGPVHDDNDGEEYLLREPVYTLPEGGANED
ncbi:hypothetical protein NDA16_001794 [Ustilago loliicola]|nr:hypothetical protein NDA16_001794 [Ustilago loliicola]